MRHSLLSAYVALDPGLGVELAKVDPTFAAPTDRGTPGVPPTPGVPVVPDATASPALARAHVVRAAEQWNTDAAGTRVHPLQLAFAAMAAFGRGPDPRTTPDGAAGLDPIVGVLTGQDPRELPGPPGDIVSALLSAGAPDVDPKARWTTFRDDDRVRGSLSPELAPIRVAWCLAEQRAYRDEYVSRVETRLVVEHGGRSLDDLAKAVVPDGWSTCNDFFCSLTRRPDRDAGCVPPATGGNLAPKVNSWRGVYEERVGSCPNGWFPDTYLLFTWSRSPRQLILRYQLAPHRPGDRTVLRIDEGYLQVDLVGPCFEVSTVKYLLFDDDFIAGGGQTLGQAACQMGWLDYSVNQFTDCARGLPAPAPAPPGKGDDRLDPRIRKVLDDCENHIVESVTETDAQVRRSIGRIRAGDYGADDWVTDVGDLAARAIRDGARSVLGYRDLLTSFVELAGTLSPKKGGKQ